LDTSVLIESWVRNYRYSSFPSLWKKLENSISSKNRSMCDPWVIALAQLQGCKVVTEESRGSEKRPKIQDVCDALGINCLRIADLIEELNWSF
jgi:hypothetical protein